MSAAPRESRLRYHAIFMAAQHQIVREEKILSEAMRLDRARKVGAQHAPRLFAFPPRLGLLDSHAVHRKEKGRREIGPQGLAVEIDAMQRVPGRIHLMTGERIP